MLQQMDSAALENLRRRMISFARRSLHDQHAAEDATQEALAALLQFGQGFRGESAWQTYAFGVLTHKIVDIQRQRGRECATDMEQLDCAEPAEETVDSTAVTQQQREEFWRQARKALAALPPRERSVFWLREVNEWSTAAVCAHLGVTANHAHVLLHRARRGLRLCWSKAAAL